MIIIQKLIKEVGKEFRKYFGREYSLVESYKLEDAEFAFVTTGAISTTIKEAINRLREKNRKVGLLRLRVYRPFPEEEIQKALKNVKKVAVIDNNVAPGYGGILFPEVKACLDDVIVSDFVVSLGGTYTGVKNFMEIYEIMKKYNKPKKYWLL